MDALILGAGYGVRLYPLTKNLPKPLLSVAGKPVIEWTIDSLRKINRINKFFVVVNDRFYGNYMQWLTDYKSPENIIIINDGTTSPDDRLGAIRDIQFVLDKEKIKDDLLVIAGDNLFDFSLNSLVSFFEKHGSSIALINLKHLDKDLLSQYGIATLDKDNKIIDFEEKPPVPKNTLAGICLYLFSAGHLSLVSKYLETGYNSDAPGFYIQWLYKQIRLYGSEMKGKWFDIGDIDSYNNANEYFSGKANIASN